MKDTAVVLVAGGKGLRFGGPVRKQYLALEGRPLVWWSIRAFERAASVAVIILVVPADDIPSLIKTSRSWGFKKLALIVPGGAARSDSVRNGLVAVSPRLRYVAVHDAVRPLITSEIIEKTIAVARRSRAAIAAIPSKDTVKIVNAAGVIQSSPKRETVWLAQTPQVFERKLLERAHHQGRALTVTDDAQLVEKLGTRVKVVEASPENMKVTYPLDAAVARIILKGRS